MSRYPARTQSNQLIDTIVDHVRRGDAKREEALEHYRQAGEGLLQLKELAGRGNWMPVRSRIASTLGITGERLRHFMKLANEWPVDWDRWQEICGNKKTPKPAPVKTPTPDPDDLDHALKLATMRDRGGTENERRVAAENLSRFASTFDMTPDVLETKAKQAAAVAPAEETTQAEWREEKHRGETPFDREYRAWLDRVRRHAADCDRETLFDLLARLHASLAVRGHDPVGDRPSWER